MPRHGPPTREQLESKMNPDHSLPASDMPAWLARVRLERSPRRMVAWALVLFAVSAASSYRLVTSQGPDESILAVAAPEAFSAARTIAPSPAPQRASRVSERATSESAQLVTVTPVAFPPSAAPEVPLDRAPRLDVVTGRVPVGGTLSDALRELGVEPLAIHRIAAALSPIFDFRRAHANDFFALIRDDAGELLSFEFRRGRRDIYRVERNESGDLVASQSETLLERREVQLGGVIDKSLFESLVELGEGPDLVHEFADIFVWDFDFTTQTRPGDEFRLVFEKFYDREGFVRYGRILAGQYRSASREMTAIYFEDEAGYGDYFTPEGTSVRRAFLRAPLKYSRISSRYSNSRLHPILKVRRPHRGIDYAAPRGTPIWAVADGKVIFQGWSGGFGRLVKVRHNNGYVSYYGHLQKFSTKLAVGSRVKQKQIVGYVGTSGLATGPHLDYRLRVDGRFVDPLRLKLPQGEPVPVQAREQFERVREGRLAALHQAQPALVLEAAM